MVRTIGEKDPPIVKIINVVYFVGLDAYFSINSPKMSI